MSVPAGRAPTPRRQTRAESRAQTPLPALQTKQSHAYGAAGKTQLNSQLTTDNAAVDAAFTTTATARKTRAATTKEPTPAPAATPARETKTRTRKTKKRAEPEAVPEEEVEDETNEAEPNGTDHAAREDGLRPDTRLDSSLSYGQLPDAPNSAAAPKERSPSPPPSEEPAPPSPVQQLETPVRASPRPKISRKDVEPWKITVFFWTFWKYIVPSAQILLMILWAAAAVIGLVFACILIWMALPLVQGSRAYLARENFVIGSKVAFGVAPYDQPPSQMESRWSEYKHMHMVGETLPNYTYPEMQWGINQNVLYRLGNAEHAARNLRDTVGSHGETLLELQRILPPTAAMITRDGHWNLTDDFLRAWAEKMTSDTASPLWNKFIDVNEQRLAQMHEGQVQTIVNGALEDLQIVTQEELQKAVTDNNDYMMQHFNETVFSFEQRLLNEARHIAEEVAEVAIQQSPYAKLRNRAIAYATIIEHANQLMENVNYLSIGLGAVVVPLHTSPTFKNPALAQGWFNRFLHRTGLKTMPPLPFIPTLPPTAALREWKEGAECWCAAPSKDEKALAQIAVQFPHKIYPGDIYLEHIPASGTRDIAAAPKKYEVWAQAENSTEAARVREILDKDFYRHYDFECGPPPKQNPSRWVCMLADEKYDIHSSNYVKRMYLNTGTDVGMTTNMIAFRVVENWGSPDHTCIYRIRMTGQEVEAEA